MYGQTFLGRDRSFSHDFFNRELFPGTARPFRARIELAQKKVCETEILGQTDPTLVIAKFKPSGRREQSFPGQINDYGDGMPVVR
jgi:hypothetical protein